MASPSGVKKSEMRVLLLPTNIASMPSITMQALEEAGVEVRAVFIDPSPFQDTGSAKVFRLKGLRFGWPHKLWNAFRFYMYVLRSVI